MAMKVLVRVRGGGIADQVVEWPGDIRLPVVGDHLELYFSEHEVAEDIRIPGTIRGISGGVVDVIIRREPAQLGADWTIEVILKW
jgi:hypothetical protein